MTRTKQFGGSLASLSLVLALYGCSGTANNFAPSAGSAADIPYAPTPDADAFYKQPDPMPTLPPGTILNSRSITFAPSGVPQTNKAWQLQYMSADVNGAPIAAVATVVMPLLSIAPSPELVSWQFAEDSLGSQCAPSHTMNGSADDAITDAEALEAVTDMDTNGWTLVIPDHEGPYSEFAAGKLAGQITLDGIRAAESFAPLGLSGVKTPVAMTGYSGGALATTWAASLQSSYAPELNIIGAAAGGTPADMTGVINNIDTNAVANLAFFSLILGAVEGVNRAYPQTATPILNAAGMTAFTDLQNGCFGLSGNGTLPPTGQVTDYTTTATPLESPGTEAILPQVSLPQPVPTVPVVNMFVYDSALDELIPVAGDIAMVNAWCADGVPVNFYEGVAGDHIVFEATAAPFVDAYLTSRFANPTATPVTPPGTTTCN